MKMIIAIVQDKDSNNLSNDFVEADVRATKLATTGGFLRSGNTTFMIGIEDERVAEVLALIKHASSKRAEYITPPVNVEGQVERTYPVEIEVGGATVFVLPVEQFFHF